MKIRHPDACFMRLAIREARKNLRTGSGGPFGACIVKKGRVLAVSRNTVLRNDATCHAEINAIRAASRRLGDFDLSGCVIYSTTEPCPMCFAAIHWARLKEVIYGTSIVDVRDRGFNELNIPALKLKKMGKSNVGVRSDFLREECRKLLKDWDTCLKKRLY